MNVLIFEYLCGGGFCAADLPASLAQEGKLMLKALLADFAVLANHDIFVMLDARCIADFVDKNIHVISVKSSDNVHALFDNALKKCDAVWIIAPETEHILFNLTKRVEEANKLLLSSPSSAVAKTADKLQTFNLLAAHNILTIPTQRLDYYDNSLGFLLVIKPIDGVGCENSFLIQNQIEFNQILKQITQPQNYIIQPFINGDALSISAIFKHGQAQLLCINRQHLEIKNQRFKLLACEVNIAADNIKFQYLLNQIAQVFPDLFGYVGIDLILSAALYVVEINPRLTSSYTGIYRALGINIADLVLQSITKTAVISPLCNQTIRIDITENR